MYHCIESQTLSALAGVFQPDERRFPFKKSRYFWDRFKSPDKTSFTLLPGVVVFFLFFIILTTVHTLSIVFFLYWGRLLRGITEKAKHKQDLILGMQGYRKASKNKFGKPDVNCDIFLPEAGDWRYFLPTFFISEFDDDCAKK